MPRFVSSVLPLLIWGGIAGANVVPAAAGEVTIGARTLKVAEGFEVELVAGPPLVERPIAVSRDERGRLYVTDSGGMTEKAAAQLASKPHRVFRLEDTDADGRYDKSTLFADRMMFPEGCLWHGGSLYVAAPPEIWKLTDTNDDGVADKREIWYDGKTLGGCANDLHGPYFGPDGRFYLCKGAFAEQTHILPSGKPFVTRASHIFRRRLDGTEHEPVLTGGMDNAVNVAFLSTGERVLSCTFFQYPAAGYRDGLLHAIYGGVYGKKQDVIYEHKQTGDVMPVLTHQGAAAPCGLWAGSRSLFGGAGADHLFACYFNLHKVVRHQPSPSGPTYRLADDDFVACDHPDFHPTDVFEDADGSLLVVDTGGWYKVCCPTSQLAKPDVLGGIYRVRKSGQPKVNDPLGLALKWDGATAAELTERVLDPRRFVSQRATAQLRTMGAPAVESLALALRRTPFVHKFRHDLAWALVGIEGEAARTALRRHTDDHSTTLRHIALYDAALWRDRGALKAAITRLKDTDDGVARMAAEALGRIADPAAVEPLLEALGENPASANDETGSPLLPNERIREHSLVYALIEIGDAKQTARGLSDKRVAVRRGALVALDQMENGNLVPEQVVPLLDSANPQMSLTAAWVVGHRPQWGEALRAHFAKKLKELSIPLTAETLREPNVHTLFVELLARLVKSPVIQEFLAEQLRQTEVENARLVALHVLANAGLTVAPTSWFDALTERLNRATGLELAMAVAAARQLPQPKGGHAGLKASLEAVAGRTDVPRDIRLEALAAAGPQNALSAEVYLMLLATLDPEVSMAERGLAASILGTATLSKDQLSALLQLIRRVGPIDLPKLLTVFEKTPTTEVGAALVPALLESDGIRGLRADRVKALFEKFPQPVKQQAEALLSRLNASAAEQAAQLDRLLNELGPGDFTRGHAVFLGKKAACINCHMLAYQGGRFGPDLTNIGKVRTERDLLEAIIFPNASFVRGYEPVVLELDDGRNVGGIIIKESRESVTIAVDPVKTQHVARKSIVEIHPGQVSPMPQGMSNVLTKQEIADLIAFLKAARR